MGFGCFRLTVAEFAKKGGFVATFPPSFSEVSADGAGGAADLVGEGVAFFCGEISGQVKEAHGSIECQLVHLQFFVVDNGSFGRGFGVAELSYESVRNRHFLKLQIMN